MPVIFNERRFPLVEIAFEAPIGDDDVDVVDGVRALVDAKVRCGLLPPSTTLAESPGLRAIVGFNEPPSAEMQRRLGMVLGVLAEPIDVWSWPDGAEPRLLLTQPRP
jgi:hypothetical protein